MSCSGLSADEIKRKLEHICTTPQTDVILQQVHDAHKHVSSKTVEIEKVEQKLRSIQLQQSQLDGKLQQDIKEKDAHVEQVYIMQPSRKRMHMRAQARRASIPRTIRLPMRTSDGVRANATTQRTNPIAQ